MGKNNKRYEDHTKINYYSNPVKTAILVDGGFYRRRAYYYNGDISPVDRAKELVEYCWRHIRDDKYSSCDLYRIFYYDCIPSNKQVFHPLKKVQ